jgi:hypothetical protein
MAKFLLILLSSGNDVKATLRVVIGEMALLIVANS